MYILCFRQSAYIHTSILADVVVHTSDPMYVRNPGTLRYGSWYVVCSPPATWPPNELLIASLVDETVGGEMVAGAAGGVMGLSSLGSQTCETRCPTHVNYIPPPNTARRLSVIP